MYITDLKTISPQNTYNNELLAGEVRVIEDKVYHAIEPNYLSFIPKGLLRRMGKAVRMGVGTGLPLVQKHNDIEGILIGTANGGLEDCIKFLNQIVEYEEGVLTPTNFVQSTPNAVAGQLALMGSNRGYNTTYTNGGLSFESTLLDSFLLFEEGKHQKLLIGGLEEISSYNYNIDSLANKYKDEIISSDKLINSRTKGTICGEGASLFIVEKDAKDYYAQIIDVAQITYPTEDDLGKLLTEFLAKNKIKASSIDSVMLGYNGDLRHNKWYEYVDMNFFSNANILGFKNLIGDFRTSSAFATWLSAHILNGTYKDEQTVLLRHSNNHPKKKILIYNHFDEVRHSFILLSK
ncbi:MAG TPA: hypothetical protein EYG86_00670 [Crocinitomicaceae bacterium]|nr:hypothetical protein [Crocinitomicaceae bacterium]